LFRRAIVSGKRTTIEIAGFARTLGQKEDTFPFCTTKPTAWTPSSRRLHDFMGKLPGKAPAVGSARAEWETAPAGAAPDADHTFFWVGGTQIQPTQTSAYPYRQAVLWVNGEPRLRFPVGVTGFSVAEDGFQLAFEARRFQSLAESGIHRDIQPGGISGIYRLTVPASKLRAGQPLRLAVELDEPPPDLTVLYYTSPRAMPAEDPVAALEHQVEQLQQDLIVMRESFEQLSAQVYPEMWPRLVPSRKVIVYQHPLHHYHPANISQLRNGELLIAIREATDHLANDGRLVLFRSRDGGESWTGPVTLFDLGHSDHRSGCIFELPSGEWLTWDYRVGTAYDEAGVWIGLHEGMQPTLWAARSSDQGRTWQFGEPITVPGALRYAEVERAIIRLPSGRLLMAGNCCYEAAPDFPREFIYYGKYESRVVVFASEDEGRTWSLLAQLPRGFCPLFEPTVINPEGERVVLIARSEAHYSGGRNWPLRGSLAQAESEDGGATWSEWHSTGMSSMSSPASLIRLHDGRLLCTHDSRRHPRSIYLTLSEDGGRTWNTAHTGVLTNNLANFDSCYPTTVQRPDGSLVSTWYANRFGRFYVTAALHRLEDLDALQ